MPIVTEAAEPEPSGREKLSLLRDFHGPFLHREKLLTSLLRFLLLIAQATDVIFGASFAFTSYSGGP